MTAQRRRKNRKWLEGVVILVLLLAMGGAGYLIWYNNFRDKGGDTAGKPAESSKTAETTQKSQEDKKESEETSTVEKPKVTQYEGEDPNEVAEATGTISGVITYAGVSGDKLLIRVSIDQYLNGGTCELKLTRGGEVRYTDTAEVTDSAATSTCAGFDVPAGSLAGANYGITINVTSDGKTGVISGEVSL